MFWSNAVSYTIQFSCTDALLHYSLSHPWHSEVTYHKGVTNLESRFSNKVIIRFEGYLYVICSWCYSWRDFLVSTPPSSYNRAGLWYIFHFHKVIPVNRFEGLVFANTGYRRRLQIDRGTAGDKCTTVSRSPLQNIRVNITNGGHACVA